MSDSFFVKAHNKVSWTIGAENEDLWTGESAICSCAHHLVDHSRNDEPEHGHCLIRGCRCIYFDSHETKKPRCKQWEGSW